MKTTLNLDDRSFTVIVLRPGEEFPELLTDEVRNIEARGSLVFDGG